MARYRHINQALRTRLRASWEVGFWRDVLKPFQFLLKPGAFLQFEPFRSSKREGLGLGLSISHSIVAGHRGRLWAENNPDGGATFYFTLPTHAAEPNPDGAI